MSSWQKKPRTMRSNQIKLERGKLKAQRQIVVDVQKRKVELLKSKPAEFFEQVLGFKPFKYQQELIGLFKNNQFIAARWCRQSGKSWSISALLLNYALNHDDSYIVSFRILHYYFPFFYLSVCLTYSVC